MKKDLITLDEALEITKGSKRTVFRCWRCGYYHRKDNKTKQVIKVYYFQDQRKLEAQKIKGVWMFNRKDIVEWNNALNDRMGVWRREQLA